MKRCPCCDSENLTSGSAMYAFGEDIYIKCNTCGLKMQICSEYGEEELEKRWNTRKSLEYVIEKLEEEKSIAFVTLANTGDDKYDFTYNEVLAYLNKAIGFIKKEMNYEFAD